MPNTVLGVSLIFINGPVTWFPFVQKNELDSERLIYLVGQKFEPRSLWFQSSLYLHVQVQLKYKVEDTYRKEHLKCRESSKGTDYFGLGNEKWGLEGFQLLHPVDILNYIVRHSCFCSI